MKVDIFDFDLDRSLIADKPASPRDSSKLLDLSEEDRITDRVFYELPEILHEGDVLVFNDTKVIPARLYGKRGKAQVEVTLYHPVDGIRWQSFIKMPNVCAPVTRLPFTPPKSRPKNRISPPKSWKKRRRRRFAQIRLRPEKSRPLPGKIRFNAVAALYQTRKTRRWPVEQI